MNDNELIAQFLSLIQSWKITDVQENYNTLQIHIWVSYPRGEKAPCPECGKLCPIYKYREERQWRHLDTMLFKIIIHCNIPWVECPIHGIKSIAVPWADVRSHFTLLFKRLAVDVLLECQKQTKARKILNVSL